MRNHKFHLQLSSYYDLEGMDKQLEEMAAKGWMLEKMTVLGWHFRRMEPKRLRFTVAYQNTFSVFDDKDDENQKAYQDLCRQSGWTLAAARGAVQVFYTEDDDAPPIETDPQIVWKAMDQLSRVSLITSILLFYAALLTGEKLLYYFRHYPIELLASPTRLIVSLFWALLFLYCVTDAVTYCIWRHKARRAAAMGEFVHARGISTPAQIIWVLFVMGLLYMVLTNLLPEQRTLWAKAVIVLGLLLMAPILLRRIQKCRGSTRCAVPANTVVSLVVIGLFSLSFTILLFGEPSWDRSRFDLDPPLAAADLTGVDDAAYSRRVDLEDSILVHRATWDEWGDGDLPCLDYTIADVQVDFLYGLCKTLLLNPPDSDGFVLLDPVGGVDAVYRYTGNRHDYVLCWDTRLVSLNASWDLTDAQLATAAAILAPQ